MGPDLALALQLADAADAIALGDFRTGLAVEQKFDLTCGRPSWRSRKREPLASASPLPLRSAAAGGPSAARGAFAVIVEEAGGRFSDFSGKTRFDTGTGLSSNGVLHDELRRAVAEQAREHA